MLKSDANKAFSDGANHFIWHTFTASPPEFGKPGIEYFAGTHFNPNVTWWEQAGRFSPTSPDASSCSAKDCLWPTCAYTGDKPYLDWGRGTKWTEKPSLTLSKGYTYDLVNTEVLLERLSVKDGRWCCLTE